MTIAGLSANSSLMSYDALRQGFFVASQDKVRIYTIDFLSCFGAQIEQFCSSCTSNNDPLACDGCFESSGFSLSASNSCSLSEVPGEKFAPRVDKMTQCCPAPKIYHGLTNRCICPKGTWADSVNECQNQPIPENCISFISLTCRQAKVGYFVKEDGKVYSCRERDPDCSSCQDISGTCLSCQTGLLEDRICIVRQQVDGWENVALKSTKATVESASGILMPTSTSSGLNAIKTV